ncbi:cobalamin-5'-phosphate synthase [Kribbella amoyensis]|uniref:Adenosylcobinamide-GDP ribazoletransferase n=1 Tax=Kribbella amoyensis TaxID=996641 RepID=A0A561BWI5_9ACTN|nr:adenosylcobinamide-GDP ribazoletransferase [Kribbella amoyensis]TWD83255.1 cobalamin-5'-phosphate synthase [Kribbella amoyensis]
MLHVRTRVTGVRGERGDGVTGVGDGLRLAFGTLTVLPAPMPTRVDRRVAGWAMVLAPVVGLVLGAIAAAVVGLVQLVKPDAELLAAVLGIVTLVVLSGALHLDGLADFADALGSRRDRETMLRIMKQSDIGPFGVIAIFAVLLIDVAALTTCLQAGFGWQAILIATTASRLTLAWSCRTTIPTARPDGLGALVASTVRPATAVVVTVLAVLAALNLTWLTSLVGDGTHLRTMIGAPLVVLAAVAAGIAVTRKARSSLGGITGDTLGTAVEIALPTALLALALIA